VRFGVLVGRAGWLAGGFWVAGAGSQATAVVASDIATATPARVRTADRRVADTAVEHRS
jgi:hypothetical protein